MSAARVTVSVAWATREVQDVVPLALPAGATVADAIRESGLARRHAIAMAAMLPAIHGRLVDADTVLVDGDRVEICRPLVADPKEARRQRALERPLPKRPTVAKRRSGPAAPKRRREV